MHEVENGGVVDFLQALADKTNIIDVQFMRKTVTHNDLRKHIHIDMNT